MKQTLLLAAFLLLTSGLGLAQTDKVHIRSEQHSPANYLQMDDFYLTHHLYIDLFLREGLFPEATVEEVSEILSAIKTYVSPDTPLEIAIKKPGDRTYLIKMAMLKKEDGTELLLAFTNWSVPKKVFEAEIKWENDSYTRWYHLNGNKMTYRKELSSAQDYTKMSPLDLANSYLWDELPENDAKIPELLEQALAEADQSPTELLMGNLLSLKYALLIKDKPKADAQITTLENLFAASQDAPNLGMLRLAFTTTKFQARLLE